MLIIEEPILGELTFWDTMLSIEKFSIPHVSGIQIVSGWYFDRCEAQSNIWSTDNNEPKL